jgi:putative pyruvate formate lyase activating enzyme
MTGREMMRSCGLCPRDCRVDRTKGMTGFCRADDKIRVAKAYLHQWEEPCISGTKGSGTVFFSRCNLKCKFCQNYKISQEDFGKEVSVKGLADIFLRLQSVGAHNINLVTATIYIPMVANAIKYAKGNGLAVPVVYNTNAYETVDALRLLDGLVDVYLPDLKYHDDKMAAFYSSAPNYFSVATRAILEMFRQVGNVMFDDRGIIKRGLIIRHLLMPGRLEDSKLLLDWIKHNLPKGVYVSIMCQYVPLFEAKSIPELNKRVTEREYKSIVDYFFNIGLENGYIQEMDSASEEYVPDFDLEGI